MPVAERNDPYLSFRFLVEIQGLIVGGFSEVAGLQAETETEDIQEGALELASRGGKWNNKEKKRVYHTAGQ
jgi:phage tail-like protein